MGTNSGFLDPLLSPTIQDDGTPKTRRANINYVGFSVTDNPQDNSTDIVNTGGSGAVAFADLSALRAATHTDGEVATVANPVGTWVYDADTGAGYADDGKTIVRPNDVSLGANGRWYNVNTSQVLPTIAALRLAESGQQSSISVQNFSTVNDGGGGIFDYAPSDTTSSDNGGTVIVAGTRRYFRRFSGLTDPRWFGAKANDGVALTDVALTSAGTKDATSSSATFTSADVGKLINIECPHNAASGTVATVSASAATGTFSVASFADAAALGVDPCDIIGNGTAFLTELFVGMAVRCTGAWGSGVTVIVTAITDDTHAKVNFRAGATASGLTLTRYYLQGTSTAFTTELTEGQCVSISGSEFHVGKIASNTKCAIYPVPGGSASGITMYRDTVFRTKIDAVVGANEITLHDNAPRTLSGLMAYYLTDSGQAFLDAIDTDPIALHAPGEYGLSVALDPGTSPLMIVGDGWNELSGQDGFNSALLSCTKPVNGSVLRFMSGTDGIITTQPNYRKLKLSHIALVGAGVLGTHGLYPTNGNPIINSNEHFWDDVCVMNFDEGWTVTQSEENKSPIPITLQSNRVGYHGAGPSTNSHIAVNAQGGHIGIWLESGTGLTFKGLSQANYEGIRLQPDAGGIEEIIFKEMHCEANGTAVAIDLTLGSVSDVNFGDGFHDYSEMSIQPVVDGGAFSRMHVGGASKIPYSWSAPGYPNDWELSGVGYLTVDPAAKRINLRHMNGVNRESCTPDNVAMTTVDPNDFTADNTTNVFTCTGHGLTTNEKIAVFATGAIPTGLSQGIPYFVIRIDDDTFKLSATYAGPAVDISDNGSGTLSFIGVVTPIWTAGNPHIIDLTTRPCLLDVPRNAPEGTFSDFDVLQDNVSAVALVFHYQGYSGNLAINMTPGQRTTFRCYHPSGISWIKVSGSLTSYDTLGSDDVILSTRSKQYQNRYINNVLTAIYGQTLDEIFVPVYNLQTCGVANTDGLILFRGTAATNGSQQAPPMVTWYGSSWCEGDSSAKNIIWAAKVLPIQSTGTTPDGEWRLQYSTDGETTFTPVMRFGKGTWAMGNIAPTASQVYTPPANHTDNRALDETASTLQDVRNVLGTLIKDLQAKLILA